MIEVSVGINRESYLAQIQAVRVKPKRTPRDGELCTYNIMLMGEVVDTFKHNYGCGIEMAIEMLKRYDKKKYLYILLSKKELVKG